MGEGKTIEARIKRMIVRTLELKIDPEEIEEDEMLFGGGLGLDSVATLEIVVGLEEEFGIEVQDEDLRVELFDSVKALADYAEGKKREMKDKENFEIIDLSPYFNNDGISYDTNRSDGDFDGHGMTFPAEELPESDAIITLYGIDFLFPDKSDGAKNNLTLEGQTIAVLMNKYSDIYILGASEWGSFEEEVTLQYADGDCEKALLGLTNCNIHFGMLRFGEKEAIKCTGSHFPHADMHSSRGNMNCGIWLQVLRANPRKELKAIQLGDNPSMHIFALTLRLA